MYVRSVKLCYCELTRLLGYSTVYFNIDSLLWPVSSVEPSIVDVVAVCSLMSRFFCYAKIIKKIFGENYGLSVLKSHVGP